MEYPHQGGWRKVERDEGFQRSNDEIRTSAVRASGDGPLARNQTVFGLLLNKPAVNPGAEDVVEKPRSSIAARQVDEPPEAVQRSIPEFTHPVKPVSASPVVAGGPMEMTETAVPPRGLILLPPSDSGVSQRDTIEAVWSKLDAINLEPKTTAVAETAKSISNIRLAEPGLDRVSLRVVESSSGLEVQVATADHEAKQDLLGGLDDLVTRVHELSLGSVIEGPDRSEPGHEFSGERRQRLPPDREEERRRKRGTGATFALPSLGASQSVSKLSPALN